MLGGMRIAFLAEAVCNNIAYRAHYPAIELARRGHTVDIAKGSADSHDVARLARFDVVYIYRHHGKATQRLATELRDAGVAIVWDNDDDIGAIPKTNPAYRRAGGITINREDAAVKRMLRVSDVVTTTNDTLAARYRTAGAEHVRVLENFLPDHFIEVERRSHPGIVVGWVAAGEHKRDYDRLGLKTTFDRLLERHPAVHIVSFGLALGLSSSRYEHLRNVPFPELSNAIAGFDIGLAPIEDIAFNAARSNVKLKEYASAGVPWLASNIGPYERLGARQGGRLVDNAEWYGAIEAMVLNDRERRRLARRGRRWARTQTIGKNSGFWEDLFSEAIARVGRRLR